MPWLVVMALYQARAGPHVTVETQHDQSARQTGGRRLVAWSARRCEGGPPVKFVTNVLQNASAVPCRERGDVTTFAITG